jgi:hypothetical protein
VKSPEAVLTIGHMTARLDDPPGVGSGVTWDRLRAAAGLHAPVLRAALPAGPGCCTVCRGPAGPGYLNCFHCAQHRQCAPGLLADVVAPISYSISGTDYARALWQYKSQAGGRGEARAALRLILLVFLRDHGPCLWARAGVAAPTHLAVVPSGRGRPGLHPLRALVEPYLALPWAGLTICPGEPVLGRGLRTGRFRAASALTGATVALLEDTWASGASAQSAAVALKLAGASRVVTVVLGRYVNPSDPHPDFLTRVLERTCFQSDLCAVHDSVAR